MLFSIANRALFRGVLAGAVILAGTSACSRSDRTETGRADTAAVMPDTTDPTALPRSDTAGYRGMERDTSTAPGTPTTRDTATAPAEPADTAQPIRDTSETSAAPIDPTAPVETAGAAAAPTDTTTEDLGAEQVDTIAQAEQADTVTQAEGDVALQARVDTARADTAVAGYAKMARDTTSTTPEQADTASAGGDVALEASVDTTHADAEVAAEAPVTSDTLVAAAGEADTAVVVGDSAQVARTGERLEPVAASAEVNDTLTDVAQAEPVRPPGDSTEVLGAEEPSTDEVGAAAIGGNVTGVEAVALMTRQGEKCIVVDPESNEEVRWDMSSTPATFNPCGIGSMNLSKIWTSKGE